MAPIQKVILSNRAIGQMPMKVELRWITPDADKEIAYMARVSNPNAKPDDPAAKLIRYLIDHKHWSPFEMACMCVEIETTRDISRQILRHRSAHFQEFSQRYSEAPEEAEFAETRIQDRKNRQSSHYVNDPNLDEAWMLLQTASWECDYERYKEALDLGIAKELSRKLLPEGLTRTRMFMQATIRDWLHYVGIRQGPETQMEHRQIAFRVGLLLEQQCPAIAEAAIESGLFRPFAFND